MTIRALAFKVIYETLNASYDHIVPQIEDKRIITKKILRHLYDMRKPKRSFLKYISKSHPPLPAVSKRLFYLIPGIRIIYNTHFLNTGLQYRLYRKVDHRLIGNRYKMLIARVCDRSQPCAFSAVCI